MSQESNEQWYYIKAKDDSCQGYMPAGSKGEACRKLGLKVKESSVVRVKWTENGFISEDFSEQGKLL